MKTFNEPFGDGFVAAAFGGHRDAVHVDGAEGGDVDLGHGGRVGEGGGVDCVLGGHGEGLGFEIRMMPDQCVSDGVLVVK